MEEKKKILIDKTEIFFSYTDNSNTTGPFYSLNRKKKQTTYRPITSKDKRKLWKNKYKEFFFSNLNANENKYFVSKNIVYFFFPSFLIS